MYCIECPFLSADLKGLVGPTSCKICKVYVIQLSIYLIFNQNTINGIFNLCQQFEISYSRYANKHITTCVYITINDNYR